MTQSKDDLEITVVDNTFTIKLDETYGATTTYLDNTDSIVYTTSDSDTDTITLDLSDITLNDNISYDWITSSFGGIEIFVDVMPNMEDVKKMCKEYPGLEKAYENFKTAYKLVEQDYKGKIKSGEIDDGIPF